MIFRILVRSDDVTHVSFSLHQLKGYLVGDQLFEVRHHDDPTAPPKIQTFHGLGAYRAAVEAFEDAAAGMKETHTFLAKYDPM